VNDSAVSMKITIDTKEDSHEEIRNAIRMLSHLVGDEVKTNAPANIFEDNSSETSGASALASMFGNDSPSPSNISNDEEENTDDDQPHTIVEY